MSGLFILLVVAIVVYAIPACLRALNANKPTTLETPFEPLPATK
jgi:carbon starvation protein